MVSDVGMGPNGYCIMGNSPADIKTVRQGQPVSANNYNKIVTGVQGLYRGGVKNAVIDGTGRHKRQSLSRSGGGSVWPETPGRVLYSLATGDITRTLTSADKDIWHTIDISYSSSDDVTWILTLPSGPDNQDMFFFFGSSSGAGKGMHIRPNTGQKIQLPFQDVSASQDIQVGGAIILKFYDGVWYAMSVVAEMTVT